MNRISPAIAIAACLVACCHAEAQGKRDIGFNDTIRPILSEHCFACHGPDAASRKADVRLDQANEAVVAGKPDESELISRIMSDDEELVMPPPGKGKPLSATQKQLLKDWIKAGAVYEKHWSFIKPKRARVPISAASGSWARNPIDHFLFARLASAGLSPNGEADRYTLARRAALDLTGLPPSPTMLSGFISDKMPDAFTRYVEKLLASQHAGEHRARYWLDAARYGDTHGMHVDNYREIWPYRDWVVGAFNRNMPFDKFVVEQLAGDLLPQATLDQRIATGFSRCNITTSEGGAIPEELNVRYMVDRVETTATVFLGLTAGCAVCHDHKYDPLPQRAFYQLGAFFNNTTQPAMDGNQKDTPPVVTLPSAEHLEEWRKLQDTRRVLRSRLAGHKPDVANWWKGRPVSPADPLGEGAVLAWPLTEGEQPGVEIPKSASWATDHPAGKRGVRFGDGGRITAKMPALRTDEPLSISFWFRTPDKLLALNLFDATSKGKKGTVGWKLTANTQGGLQFEFHDGAGKRIRALLPGDEALKPHSWQHVCVRYSGGQSNSSVTILVNGTPGRLRNSTEDLMSAADVPAGDVRIGSKLPTAALSDIRMYRRWVSDHEVRVLAREFELIRLLKSKQTWDQLPPESKKLAGQYHKAWIDAGFKKTLHELCASERRRDYIYSRSTTTLVMQERKTKPHAYILQRGEYDQRGERVTPAIPEVLNFPGTSFAKGNKGASVRNRLDLARWLVHPDHPLTARVMVNRLWQSLFGVGIVKTSEDFGVMGDRPSHPALLDWLAVEFVESGWDVNHILKLMVTSSAYRQAPNATPRKLEKDRDNRLLSRGPRLRLDAEVLRDQVLMVSGLLRRRLGGPSVKPYQPAGLWNVVAITGSNTRVFKKDAGDKLYRRSLYTFWKRTSPPPSMAAFNAPTREQCTVRRERTNTPLQALVLMNDPQFVEAARSLAQMALRREGTDRERASWMLTTVLSRPALPLDVKEMAAAAADFRRIFKANTKMAERLIREGDSPVDERLDPAALGAWTMVASILMNRDDFLTK